MAKEGFVEGSTSWNLSVSKTTHTPQVKSEVHKSNQESTLRRCYKCQGLGHIGSECPNRKAVTLIKEYEAKGEDMTP